MEFQHKPVMLNEVIDSLKIRPEGTYVDGTLGGAAEQGIPVRSRGGFPGRGDCLGSTRMPQRSRLQQSASNHIKTESRSSGAIIRK